MAPAGGGRGGLPGDGGRVVRREEGRQIPSDPARRVSPRAPGRPGRGRGADSPGTHPNTRRVTLASGPVVDTRRPPSALINGRRKTPFPLTFSLLQFTNLLFASDTNYLHTQSPARHISNLPYRKTGF